MLFRLCWDEGEAGNNVRLRHGFSLQQCDHFRLRAPPYAATVAVELYDNGVDAPYVQIIYKNESALYNASHDGHILTVRNCTPPCTLETLERLVQDVIPDDWHAVG